ncbi:diacylglycerol/lipid kinase family protein [Hyphomicrobium methylovorum]|uniref:diacylglycerol/lipid kinase family protein n=1 Tax=Hyphomicrobium methylovorum TaxID=84 RepID=UPI001FEAE5D3|nr:diacylglycerol kinase family protein [Hyphomicrobium methylovorum]
MRRRFALIFNARAGHALPRLLDGVLARLRAEGCEVFQVPSRSAEEASERVAELAKAADAPDAVIAAGGDGTFRAVATGAAGTDLPVGFVPLGTGNVLAHELGLSRRVGVVTRTLLSGKVIDVGSGLANGKPFFLMAGAGFDARIVSRLNYRAKRVLGRAAYAVPVLKTLAEGPVVFDVDIDGRLFEASWVIITLASRYGGSLVLTRETVVGEESMVAVVFEAQSRFALSRHAIALALGRLASGETCPKGVSVLPVRKAAVGHRWPVPIEIDGDVADLSPLVITADGPRVRLIVPDSHVADLTKRHTNRLP